VLAAHTVAPPTAVAVVSGVAALDGAGLERDCLQVCGRDASVWRRLRVAALARSVPLAEQGEEVSPPVALCARGCRVEEVARGRRPAVQRREEERECL
jgi:hypothetical protein